MGFISRINIDKKKVDIGGLMIAIVLTRRKKISSVKNGWNNQNISKAADNSMMEAKNEQKKTNTIYHSWMPLIHILIVRSCEYFIFLAVVVVEPWSITKGDVLSNKSTIVLMNTRRYLHHAQTKIGQFTVS